MAGILLETGQGFVDPGHLQDLWVSKNKWTYRPAFRNLAGVSPVQRLNATEKAA